MSNEHTPRTGATAGREEYNPPTDQPLFDDLMLVACEAQYEKHLKLLFKHYEKALDKLIVTTFRKFERQGKLPIFRNDATDVRGDATWHLERIRTYFESFLAGDDAQSDGTEDSTDAIVKRDRMRTFLPSLIRWRRSNRGASIWRRMAIFVRRQIAREMKSIGPVHPRSRDKSRPLVEPGRDNSRDGSYSLEEYDALPGGTEEQLLKVESEFEKDFMVCVTEQVILNQKVVYRANYLASAASSRERKINAIRYTLLVFMPFDEYRLHPLRRRLPDNCVEAGAAKKLIDSITPPLSNADRSVLKSIFAEQPMDRLVSLFNRRRKRNEKQKDPAAPGETRTRPTISRQWIARLFGKVKSDGDRGLRGDGNAMNRHVNRILKDLKALSQTMELPDGDRWMKEMKERIRRATSGRDTANEKGQVLLPGGGTPPGSNACSSVQNDPGAFESPGSAIDEQRQCSFP